MACLNYYSESNFEYSRSISDYSESIAQLSAVWYLTNASYSLASLDVFCIPDERKAVSLTATRRFSMSEKPSYSTTLNELSEPYPNFLVSE